MSQRYHWRQLVRAASLLICVIGAGAVQAASADEAVPVPTHDVDRAKAPAAHDAVPTPRTKHPDPATAARASDAQASIPNPAAQPLKEKASRPDAVAPPPEAQKPAPAAAVQKPETQTASHGTKDVAVTDSAAKDSAVKSLAAKDLAVPQLVLSADMAKKIGQKIWLNETGGKSDAITSWSGNEDFASLGIGHFIWFPINKWLPFEESFPGLLEFMRNKKVHLPAWLDQAQIPANPWNNRAEFKRDFNSPRMRELRQFLLDTVAEQTQFMVARAQGAMEKILKNTPDGTEREHIVTQFTRVVRGCEDLYPLIDYINFKGEGTNPNEAAPDKQTGQRQGWGLKQVLLKMSGTTSDSQSVRAAFADAVQAVLQQRVRNIPANRVFEIGWLRRADTYRRPIAELEPGVKRAQGATVGAVAAR